MWWPWFSSLAQLTIARVGPAETPHCGWYGSSMVRPWLFRLYEAWKNQTITAIVNEDVLITSHIPKEEYTPTLLIQQCNLRVRLTG